MVHLFIFWPSTLTLEPLCHPAPPDWHFCKLLGDFCCCHTDSVWQLAYSEHVQSLSPMGHNEKVLLLFVVAANQLSTLHIFQTFSASDHLFLSWSLSLCECLCVCVLVCASFPNDPQELYVACSSPKSSWPSSNKPISCNQELSHPLHSIDSDICTQTWTTHTHSHTHRLYFLHVLPFCP